MELSTLIEKSSANPKRIRRAFLPHPPARRKPESRRFEKSVEAKQILSSRKIALLCLVHLLSPRTARILGGQNPERKTPSPFSKEISPPPNQKCKECFFFRGCWRTRQCVGLQYGLGKAKIFFSGGKDFSLCLG